MYNSSILTWIESLLLFFGNAYRESVFNRLFLSCDSLLKKAALNSRIVSLFIIKRGKKFIETSMVYGVIDGILKIAAKTGKVLGAWTLESKTVRMVENIISYTLKNVYRILGIFAVSFLVTNISFGLILHRESRNVLIFKLLLLIISLIAARITADFGKTLRDSKFYEIFQWIIEVEK